MNNTKERTQAIQAMAMEIVQIRPLSNKADSLIKAAIIEHGFTNRADAFQFLRSTGKLRGIDIGGETLNTNDAVQQLMDEFGCAKSTARRHVARAARRKRHPDWRPPAAGGPRSGSGFKPSHHAAVRELLASGRFTVDQVNEMAAELDCHPRTVARALDRLANESKS